MKKRKPELKPDIVLKNYWRNNEQFADLFNALLFDGKQMIEPEELTDIDSEESLILEHKKYAESVKASRDNIYDAWDGIPESYSLCHADACHGI